MKPELLKSIERLEPAAFTIIMATGAMAIVLKDLCGVLPFLETTAEFLNWANFLLFFFLLIFACSTWPFHGGEFHEDLDFPQRTAFYSAIGISFLVLAAQCLKFSMGFQAALYLWLIGCCLTMGINFAINYHFFVQTTPAMKLFTPVFFIPVGGLMVIPVAGCAIMGQTEGQLHSILLLLNALALGSGTLHYLGLFCLLLQRHYFLEHLPHNLAPTIWIHLAPIGWGGVSMLNYAEQLQIPEETARLLGSMFWGGCCWWLVMCILLTLRAVFSGQMKFSLAYWAFIFPLGSITVLSHKLGASYEIFFYFCASLMAFIWCVAAFHTLRSFAIYIMKRGHPHS